MSTEAEVDLMMETLRDDAAKICLMHCVSAYPAPTDASNLRVIPSMMERYQVPVGWSDHTIGDVTSVAAVALGASLLEKHLTLDVTLAGPDHKASTDPHTFKRYVDSVRSVEAARGDGLKRPHEVELELRDIARRSLHATRTLAPGHSLREEDVKRLRPATGLPANTKIEGLTLIRNVQQDSPITEADVADNRGLHQ
jgi:N-acetylneuraminate synthase/N,N'-diacetyllegionaminate synthase